MGHAYLRNVRDVVREESAKLLGLDNKSAKQLSKPSAVESVPNLAEAVAAKFNGRLQQ